MKPQSSVFYEFHVERNMGRPGEPYESKLYHEIGPQIERAKAVEQVRRGLDIYTLNKGDAKDLAFDTFNKKSGIHTPHESRYFQHFHPGNKDHEYGKRDHGRLRTKLGPGHVFFGLRGENYNPTRALEMKLLQVQEQEESQRAKKIISKRHDKEDL